MTDREHERAEGFEDSFLERMNRESKQKRPISLLDILTLLAIVVTCIFVFEQYIGTAEIKSKPYTELSSAQQGELADYVGCLEYGFLDQAVAVCVGVEERKAFFATTADITGEEKILRSISGDHQFEISDVREYPISNAHKLYFFEVTDFLKIWKSIIDEDFIGLNSDLLIGFSSFDVWKVEATMTDALFADNRLGTEDEHEWWVEAYPQFEALPVWQGAEIDFVHTESPLLVSNGRFEGLAVLISDGWIPYMPAELIKTAVEEYYPPKEE